MTTKEIKECLQLLAKAIERVAVNTYCEQGALAADEVFAILEKAEKIIGEKEQRNCSNCNNKQSKFCNDCITAYDSTPSHWKAKESEDTE